MPRRSVPVLLASHLGLLACSAGDDGAADASATITGEGSTTATTTTTTGSASASATTDGTTTSTTASTTTSTTSTTATSTTSTTGESDTATTGDLPPIGACEPLPPPDGPVVDVTPGEAADLPQLVADAASGTTILLADGTYDLSGGGPLHFTTPGVALRSASGDPEAVILDAGYAVGEIALVAASDVTIAEITLQRAMWHPIHVTGGDDEDTAGVVIHRVRVIDPGQQAIKINASPAGHYADDGAITCSTITLTDGGRAQIQDNCYTGGIDAHSARGWLVADNTIDGFWCEQGLSEHAIHFWVTGRDTEVVRNTIVDCARGIGFGLGQSGNGKERVYDDDPCAGAGYLGHVDGIIRNNMILARSPGLFASQSGFDAGVALEQACGARVVHNTIVSLEPPFVSIEYRWENTSAVIENNLVTHTIVARDGGTAELAGNLEGAALSAVVDAGGGDLHLSEGSPAIDAGVTLAPGVCDDDFDGEVRDAAPDVGADERAG